MLISHVPQEVLLCRPFMFTLVTLHLLMYMLLITNKKPLLDGCTVTLVTVILYSFMYSLNMPNKHTPPRGLIIKLVTIKCHPIMLCLLCSVIWLLVVASSTLITDRLYYFMNRQFVFWYTGSLRSFVVALVTVISNLFR